MAGDAGFVAGGIPALAASAQAPIVVVADLVAPAVMEVSATAELALREGHHAALYLSVVAGDRIWGQLGMARRAALPFDSAAAAHLGCAAALLGQAMTGGGQA